MKFVFYQWDKSLTGRYEFYLDDDIETTDEEYKTEYKDILNFIMRIQFSGRKI